MSAARAPVSSTIRETKVGPTRLTMELVTWVAMISRRSRWRSIAARYSSRSGRGK